MLGVFLILALLGVPALLPPVPRLLLPVLVLAATVAVAWLSARRLRPPTPGTVDRRLEAASGLRHRPLLALADHPSSPDPRSAEIWRVHQARLRAQLGRLRVGAPRPGLPGRDRRALRGLLVLGLAVAAAVAGTDAPGRLLLAVAPGLPPAPAAPGTAVQAWATPPAYTGLPPVILQPGTPAVSLPVGSRLTVSVTGGSGLPSLSLNGAAAEMTLLAPGAWQAEREVSTPDAGQPTTALEIRRGLSTLSAWTVTVIPDRTPTAVFADPPGPALANGRPTGQTRMAWRAEDDYGVTAAGIELSLKGRPEAQPVLLPAPLSGSPRQARGTLVQDLTAHPWAGLPVVARATARDALNQLGRGDPAEFTLPERPFTHPAARLVIAVRRQLSLTPDARRDARSALDALADRPDTFENSATVLLQLRAIGALLTRGRGQPAVDEAQSRMWSLALSLEEGTAERTARALEQARQAMRDAMDATRQDPKDAEKLAEMEKRAQELRDAIQKHVDALLDQAKRDGTPPPFDPRDPQMNTRDLDRMTQEMEKAAREGRMDDAKQQLAELERLLEQLQNARPEQGEQREQRNAERRQQGRQQQDAVQDMVRREGELLDRSRNRAETGPRSPPQPGPQAAPQPGQQAGQPPPASREADARRQAAMRRALGELMQRFGDLTGQVPAPLGEADAAMREAGQAMADGRDAAAGAAQQKAIEALQKGGREMGQQVARQFGTGQQPGEGEDGEGSEGQDGPDGPDGNGVGPGENPSGRDGQSTSPRPGEPRGPSRRRSAARDPLGRPLQQGTGGTDESADTRVPDQMEEARTRALQEELRRRGGERTRPQDELDYIDRLLKSY